MEVFGCHHRTLKRTMDALQLVLTMSMGPNGELKDYPRAVWHPLGGRSDKAMGMHLSDGWWEDMATPAKLGELMGEVCAGMGS
jgi:hypothetical protein